MLGPISCVKCGFSDPRALSFHHRDPKTKEFGISEALRRNTKLAKVVEEVKKCDILCLNCHAILHAEQHDEGDYEADLQAEMR